MITFTKTYQLMVVPVRANGEPELDGSREATEEDLARMGFVAERHPDSRIAKLVEENQDRIRLLDEIGVALGLPATWYCNLPDAARAIRAERDRRASV